jgi:hypothetical protein
MAMRYTFTHQIHFDNGTTSLPYRSTRWWKTSKGAMRAAELHAKGMEVYYENFRWHALTIFDDGGNFVTNMAA